jgi:tRNA pseudouridine38-40 synthase
VPPCGTMADMTAAEDDVVRLRLDLGYDGTAFSGWARQPGRRTVQQTIEDAFALVLRVRDVRLTVAGRTDAGVHARGQVAHVDLDRSLLADRPPDQLLRRLARVLPDDVVARRLATAPSGFDARFSALSRRYCYRLDDDPGNRDPLRRTQVLWWPRSLDVRSMHQAAQGLLGEHDFAAFCKPRDGATTIRTLIELDVRRAEGEIEVRVVADAFCHNMVRALVGALVVVGEGRRSPGWPALVLGRGERDPAAPVVPAHGLTLESVAYPPAAELGARAETARSVRSLR